MRTSFEKEIRLIGVGDFSSDLCKHFNDRVDTISFLKSRNHRSETKVTFVIKEFDYAISQEITSILEYEREIILRHSFSEITILITQLVDKFNESITRGLINFLSRRGSFIVLVLLIPLGSEGDSYKNFLREVRDNTDIIEVVNPENIINNVNQYQISELNTIYLEKLEDLIYSMELLLTNGNLLGINIRDLKEQSTIFGPLSVKVFKYKIDNFQILERDIMDFDSSIKRDSIKRVYVIMLLTQNHPINEPMGLIKYLKSKYKEVRNAFYRNDDIFGAILIYSS